MIQNYLGYNIRFVEIGQKKLDDVAMMTMSRRIKKKERKNELIDEQKINIDL